MSRENGKNNAKTDPAEKPSFGRFSRRSFLSRLGATGAAAAASPLLGLAQTQLQLEPVETPAKLAGAIPVTLLVNGQEHQVQIDPRTTLLDCLRETLHLTGTKKGCDHGQCGACTVHIKGRRVNSCLTFAAMHHGDEITTIEGVARGEELHPLQAAFIAHDGFQCGFCTPGQIMSALGLIHEGQAGCDAERIREAMSGNLCRCGAYAGITEAVLEVQKSLAAARERRVA